MKILAHFIKQPPLKHRETMVSDNNPKCKNCKYFLKKSNTNPYLNECLKFGRVSTDNKVQYEFTEWCREQIDLCGPTGFYFEMNKI